MFTVWAEAAKSVAAQIIEAAMSLAETPVTMPAGEPFYRFCSVEENRRVLGAAGFDTTTIVVTDLPAVWHLVAAADLYDLFAQATTRSALVLAALASAVRRG